MKVYYNDGYVSSGVQFETTTKSAAVKDQLEQLDSERWNISIADPISYYEEAEKVIGAIHDHEYVEAVLTGSPLWLAESQGFIWDENIYQMAVSHSSGIIAAVHDAVVNGESGGSLSSGLHHAKSWTGEGYCTFNGLAAGAYYGRQLGAKNIAVIDLDAHHGGGTNEIVGDFITHIDISTNSYDSYLTHDGSTQLTISNEKEYLPTIKSVLDSYSNHSFDLVIYNSGMDPRNDGFTNPTLLTREQIVFDWLAENQFPFVFVLAGGYTWNGVKLEDIISLHVSTALNAASARQAQTVA